MMIYDQLHYAGRWRWKEEIADPAQPQRAESDGLSLLERLSQDHRPANMKRLPSPLNA